MTPSATTFAACREAAAIAPSTVPAVPGGAETAVTVRRRSGRRPPPPSPAGRPSAV